MTRLALWVLRLVWFLSPPASNDPHRMHEEQAISIVIADVAGEDLELAANLVAIAWYESGFRIHARGRCDEVGPWQLMPTGPCCPQCAPVPTRLRDQAREAARRLRVQGWEGYTGEAGGRCPAFGCPLAAHRRLAGAMLFATFREDLEAEPDAYRVARTP